MELKNKEHLKIISSIGMTGSIEEQLQEKFNVNFSDLIKSKYQFRGGGIRYILKGTLETGKYTSYMCNGVYWMILN
jgi:hypothetical protein